MKKARAFMNEMFYDRTPRSAQQQSDTTVTHGVTLLNCTNGNNLCYERWARGFDFKNEGDHNVCESSAKQAITLFDPDELQSTVVVCDTAWMLALERIIRNPGLEEYSCIALGCCKELDCFNSTAYFCPRHLKSWIFVYDNNIDLSRCSSLVPMATRYNYMFVHQNVWKTAKKSTFTPTTLKCSLYLISSPESPNLKTALADRKRSCSPTRRSRFISGVVNKAFAAADELEDAAAAAEELADIEKATTSGNVLGNTLPWINKMAKRYIGTLNSSNVLVTGEILFNYQVVYVCVMLKILAVKDAISCSSPKRLCFNKVSAPESCYYSIFVMIAHISRNLPPKFNALFFTIDADRMIPAFRDDDANAGIDICFDKSLIMKSYYTPTTLGKTPFEFELVGKDIKGPKNSFPLGLFNYSGPVPGYYVQIASRSSAQVLVYGGGVGDSNYLGKQYLISLEQWSSEMLLRNFPELATSTCLNEMQRPILQAVLMQTPDCVSNFMLIQGWGTFGDSRD